MNKRLFLAIVVAIIATLSTPAAAQDHGPPAGGSDKNLRDSASDLKGRSIEIDRIGRDAKKPDSRKNADKPENRPAPNFLQIKEDFEQVQLITSDVLQPSLSSAKPDYQRISESAGEIEKRAIRLKSNLFPPKSTKQSKEKEPATEDQELKSLLTLLDNSIGNFTQSPMFQNSKVVNPEDHTKAEQELDAVIKVSVRIRNEADRIKKAGSPPE
jgi:hypothetical protein